MAKDDESDSSKSDPPGEFKSDPIKKAQMEAEASKLVEMAVRNLNENVKKGTLTN